MPHKKNPIGAENISGLARVIRGQALAALEDVALWHERDISHSSVERIIAPDATSLVDYMLVRLKNLVAGLVVHPERMARNLALTGGLYNSQEILLLLCGRGLPRGTAYELVQGHALRSHREGLDFKTLLLADPDITDRVSLTEIEAVFRPDRFLGSVDAVFERVFGNSS
jgi:adenylosuccinate lyase